MLETIIIIVLHSRACVHETHRDNQQATMLETVQYHTYARPRLLGSARRTAGIHMQRPPLAEVHIPWVSPGSLRYTSSALKQYMFLSGFLDAPCKKKPDQYLTAPGVAPRPLQRNPDQYLTAPGFAPRFLVCPHITACIHGTHRAFKGLRRGQSLTIDPSQCNAPACMRACNSPWILHPPNQPLHHLSSTGQPSPGQPHPPTPFQKWEACRKAAPAKHVASPPPALSACP